MGSNDLFTMVLPQYVLRSHPMMGKRFDGAESEKDVCIAFGGRCFCGAPPDKYHRHAFPKHNANEQEDT